MFIGFLRLLGALVSVAARPRSRRVQHRIRSSGPLPLAFIHWSAWNRNSANFAFWDFSEVELRHNGVLRSLLPDLTQSFQGVVHLGEALGSKDVLG